jgi:hypothetical protein
VDTDYGDHGLVSEKSGGYLAKGEPETNLFAPRSTSLIPSSVKHRYDGLEREVRSSAYEGGAFKYATYTSYSWTSMFVDPAGSTAPSLNYKHAAESPTVGLPQEAQKECIYASLAQSGASLGLLQQQKNRRAKPPERGLDLRFFKLYISSRSSPDGAHGRWMQDAPLVIEAVCSLDRSVV